jgi:uncharacterized protein (TIGR00251 family)
VTGRHPLIRQHGPDVLVAVHVQPRASRNQVIWAADRVTVRLTAPPVGGAANAACCASLAELFNLPKSRLSVIRGQISHEKLIRIAGSHVQQIFARLQAVASPQKCG